MSKKNLLGVQAFLACDKHGRSEPVVVTIFDSADTTASPIGAEEVDALEKVIAATGYEGLVSFLIEAAYLEHMQARASFVMTEFFEQERSILLVRCDSEIARREFLNTIKADFELKPITRRRAQPKVHVASQPTA